MPISRDPGARSLGATFVTLALAYGVWYAYSVFLVALLREFGWSRSVLAGAFSVFSLVHGAAGLPLGWLVDRVGPRRLVMLGGAILGLALTLDGAVTRPWHLYVTFGLLTSTGVALAGWVPAVILAQRWFPLRMGTALGITSAGIGVGIFLVVPACQWLIDHLGWRWAFRITGVAIAAWVIPAAIWLVRDPARPSPSPSPPRGEGRVRGEGSAVVNMTLWDALATRRFWLLGLAYSANGFANQMLLVHQVAYLVDQGIATILAASVVGVVGMTSIAGKAGGGWVSDHVDRRVTYSLATLAVAASVGMLGLVALAPSAAWAYLYAVLIGLGYSVPAAVTPALVSDRFQSRHFGSIFGALQVTGAVGGSLGPWVAGRIFDATGSYASAFLSAVGAVGLATAALWLTGPGRPRVAS